LPWSKRSGLHDCIRGAEEKYEAHLQSLKQAEQQVKSKAKDEPQSTLPLQIIPSPQNIPSNSSVPDQSPPQNIVSTLPDQSPPQNIVSSLPEHLPPQNIPSPQIGQQAGPTRTDHSPFQDINANNITMQQAVELFELLQARKTREAEKSVTVEVEAQPFEREPRRRTIVLPDLWDSRRNWL
jgi:hypothetical protein